MLGKRTIGSFAVGGYTLPDASAPTPDTTSPVMVGSLVVSAITQTTAHAAWQSATDNVGVVGYEFSCDTGTPTWLNVGMALSADPVGLTAATNYTARARSYDDAGNYSAPITYQFVTLDASVDTDPDPNPDPGVFKVTVRFIPLNRRRR